MAFVHILLEVYCGYDCRSKKDSSLPQFCKNGNINPGYHCFENECPFVSYTYCPNEIAYTGVNGEVEDNESWIGFGGEMEPNDNDESKRKELVALWERICKKKIEEAYDEFMKEKDTKKP